MRAREVGPCGVAVLSSLRRSLTRAAGRPAGPPVARRLSYLPRRNGRADPGEVVWASVTFEEDPRQSKDRPVLVVGRKDRRTVYGLMLSTAAHRAGQDGWLALGSGSWDAEGRASSVRLDRVLELPVDGLRREGGTLDRKRFRDVSSALRARHGWQ
jgi:mRNA-degrading endonuclease toxin of MazEF toxin-antitoxin module